MDYKKLYLQKKREYLKHKHIIKGGSSRLCPPPDKGDNGYSSDSSNFSDKDPGKSIFNKDLDSFNFSDEPNDNGNKCDPSYTDFKKHGDDIWIESVAKINDYEERNKYLSTHLEECVASLKSKDTELEEYSVSLKSKETELEKCSASLKLKETELEKCIASLKSKETELEKCSTSLKSKETELEECSASLKLKETELEECIASLSSEEKSYKTLYKEQREQIAKQNIKIVELEGEIYKRNFDMGEK